MRVLYFTRDYTPHDHRFLTSLAESGQEVFYLRLERRGRQVEDRALPPEIQHLRWAGGQSPFRWRDLPVLLLALRGVIRRVQPDVLHAGPIQTAAFLAALSGFRPLVSMSWGSDLLKDADRSRTYRWITRYTLQRSTVLVGDCAAVREKAAEFGFPRQRAFLFPWGIDLERFSPLEGESLREARQLRERLGWENNFVILSLRSWEPVYGVDVLLRGFAIAAGDAPELRLLLLGGGSQAPLVHRMIQQYDLLEHVHLGGQVNQASLPDVYRCADLYASAAHSDGSSVSLMEALASANPVLVSDIPGNREWVQDGEQGWLFRDGSEQGLADGILRAHRLARENPSLLAEIGKAARLTAEQRADWRKNFPVLLEAYQQAVELR